MEAYLCLLLGVLMGVIRITEAGYVPAGTCYTYSPDPVVQEFPGSTTSALLRWAREVDALIVGDVVRDGNGALVSASVIWPDGSVGDYTTLVASSTFLGAVDSYSITYGTPVSKTFTQPLMTRNIAGLVINLPDIVVS